LDERRDIEQVKRLKRERKAYYYYYYIKFCHLVGGVAQWLTALI